MFMSRKVTKNAKEIMRTPRNSFGDFEIGLAALPEGQWDGVRTLQ
jgi:5,10-methylenetetrahydrofolate reductase